MEWFSCLSPQQLEKTTKLIQNSKELSSLSGRQLSLLLLAYGKSCVALPPEERRILFKKALKAMEKLSLPVECKRSIHQVDMENGVENLSLANMAEDLVEEDGSLDVKSLLLLGRAYALQGDLKGVIEIVNEVKSETAEAKEELIGCMAYAMMKQAGEASLKHIQDLMECCGQKLTSSTSSSVSLSIWCSAALAAATRGETRLAAAALSHVPVGAGLEHYANNRAVLEIFAELLDRDAEDVEKAIIPYLWMDEDGKTVNEKHVNGWIMDRVRRALKEKKIETAARLCAIAHPSAKSRRFLQENILVEFERMGGEGGIGEEKIEKIAQVLQNSGVIRDAGLFLVQNMPPSPLFISALSSLYKDKEAFEGFLRSHDETKYEVAKKVYKHFGSAPLPEAVAEASKILYAVRPISSDDTLRIHKLTFTLAQKDPIVIKSALSILSSDQSLTMISRHLATSVLHELLMEEDVLVTDRIDRLLSSDSMPFIFTNLLQSLFLRLLLSAKAEKDVEKATRIVASILALDQTRSKEERMSRAARNVIRIAASKRLPKNTFTSFVSALLKAGLGLSKEEMELASNELEKVGQKERAVEMEHLRMKGQVMKRWQESTLDMLVEEFEKLESSPDVKPEIKFALVGVILHKLAWQQKDVDISLARKWLDLWMGPDKKGRKTNQADVSRILFKLSLQAEKEIVPEAVELLLNRPQGLYLPTAGALLLACRSFLSGDTSAANKLAAELRNSAASIDISHINFVGERISEESEAELERVGDWLRNTFGMEKKTVRKLVTPGKRSQLAALLNDGKLKEAVDFCREVSQKMQYSFGHLELFAHAIRSNKTEILEEVFNNVSSLHSKAHAIMDLAFVMIMEGNQEHGIKLFQAEGVYVNTEKLKFYAQMAVDKNRIDVLRHLLTALTKNQTIKAKNEDIQELISRIAIVYQTRKSSAELSELYNEVLQTGIVLSENVKRVLRLDKSAAA